MQKKIFLLVLFFIINTNSYSQTKFPYHLNPIKETIIGGVALITFGSSLVIHKNKAEISQAYINNLDSKSVNNFDYSATKNYSESWAKYSDITLSCTAIAAASSSFLGKNKRHFLVLSTLYIETTSISISVNYLEKNIINRARPMFYGSQIDMKKKLELGLKNKDGLMSFYSGHSSFAFTNASFISKVIFDLYPDKKWKYAVAGVAYTTAASIAFARWKAGKHFPTDIITGSLIGTLIGWTIPQIHKSEKMQLTFLPLQGGLITNFSYKL